MAKKKEPTKKQRETAKKQYSEFEKGELNIGKSDKKVTDKKQATAIMLNTLGISKKKGKK